MRLINTALIISLFALFMTGCYKDKGNYDYKDLLAVDMDTVGLNLSSGVTAYWFENFTLDPKVKYAGDAKDIAYTWRIYPQKLELPEGETKFDSAKVLAHTAVFNEIIYDAPGEYYLNFEAWDKVSDTKTYLTVKLKIESLLSRGLCVLDERDGLFDLNMIKSSRLIGDLPIEKEGIVYNVFSTMNPDMQITDATFMTQLFPRSVAGNFFVFSNTGGYKLNKNTFEVITSEYSSLFSFPSVMTFVPQAHVTVTSGSPAEILLNAGKLYRLSYMNSDVLFGPELGDGYEAAPFIVKTPNNDNPVLFFDRLNKKFVPMGLFGEINAFESTPGAAFDVNNIDKELVNMQQGFNNYTYAIFKDKSTAKLSLYEGDFSDKQPVPKTVYDMSVCTGIDENTIFALGSRGAYCFYASGHQVYRYDYLSNSVDDNAIPAFANETVTCMKVFQKSGHPLDGKLLIVATCDDTSGEGKVYFLDFNEISGTINKDGLKTPYDKFGRIKDFINKE